MISERLAQLIGTRLRRTLVTSLILGVLPCAHLLARWDADQCVERNYARAAAAFRSPGFASLRAPASCPGPGLEGQIERLLLGLGADENWDDSRPVPMFDDP